MQYPSAWLQGSSLGESIACELRLRIVNGSVKPGEVLSENRIASDFGTSRSPVREALKTLSGEGLIRLERMGAVVIGLNRKDVEELYDVRYLIEGFVQQRIVSMPQATNPDALLQQLQQIVDKMELAAKHGNAVDFSYHDMSFHEAIVLRAGHTRMIHLWNSIRHLVMAVMLVTTENVFSQGTRKISDVIEKHRKIMQSMESNDIELIQKGARDYFADSLATLHRSFPSG
ncbi:MULTISPECIES: GntR family transcriptional regulator [unclassified Paenibacillus]|uniref:GntR family transcriptional regulator n=1 Tax=unclassified Paenibacillus TaxID=185978 RepID=UPI001C0FF792|nr:MULTISPECIES: GntR family transcriptional regulator [unclassified Paenibacillus]MBU5441337.1 GntR family transcriptional regulator [Paenibacillus sp. MSJ-34]CAH0120905.1 putative D-xylose utilization operon transcriptional repressor [Paenibacillus sp. CECT 9249]